ncbi:MAG: oxygen-independent coproporphyrinogen III oxidase [Deltaproteobacteria bacterium CG_4_10_14_0_2_um_filter_43_8]|nr:MAG: oxygen-independent coproporphyrinogen III oxidase [Deltaproteobacteria bacterium CG_4_10_14_0_2_um_filter_43_8]PJC64765.1 MAG: oxygen-independent coproporphyrinogen III oxidase [Deltaproteobacteria bacterium CG_4_9_14_0_2_um_filter_42_21]
MSSFLNTIIDGKQVSVPDDALITAYDKALPRYTSYPTAPVWTDSVGVEAYQQNLVQLAQDGSEDISLYIHLPFCEQHCTFCACSMIATKKREVIDPYLKAVKAEFATLSQHLGKQFKIKQLHLGGGTPTYLDEEQMEELLAIVNAFSPFHPDAEISIECDPRWTSASKLQTLRKLGFNRLSFGVQDVVPEVQEAIGRIQPLEVVQACLEEGRCLGFLSLNIDLVYGLPLQTRESWKTTLAAVETLNPDRIALFSFAFVPWMKVKQRSLTPEMLPHGKEKLAFFTDAIQTFANLSYDFIGLDHFAKKNDELSLAHRNHSLHRNFQGYSTHAGLDMIGVGMTSIGYVGGSFFQNEKKLSVYQDEAMHGKLSTIKGYHLTQDDHVRKWVISHLFCRQRIVKHEFETAWGKSFDEVFATENAALQTFAEDGLVVNTADALQVTSLGRLFIRNVASVFDAYMQSGAGKFSRSV